MDQNFMAKPRKILLIAYYAPPVQVTGNIRRFHLFQEFQQHFSQLFILTSSNGGLMRQDPSLKLYGIPVSPIPTYDLRRLLLSPKKQKGPTLDTRVKSNRGFRWFRRISDSFPFNLFLDDGGLIYIWQAYIKACQLIQQESIQYIFSSFRPAADHVVAYLLKRKFPQLIWIADFRDLPVDPLLRNTVFPNLQLRSYKRILRKAKLVTTVSSGLATHLAKLHPSVYVLPNAIPLKLPSPSEKLYVDKFTITYTGSLYPTQQDVASLLKVVQQLLLEGLIDIHNFQLIYAGKDGKYWDKMIDEHHLQSIQHNKGLIQYDEAFALQQRGHINLLLSWSSPQLQGVMMAKQGSYLAARRPILVIINGVQDAEWEQQFQALKAGPVFYTANPELNNQLKNYLYRQFCTWQETKTLASEMMIGRLVDLSWKREVEHLIKELSKTS